MTDEELAAIEAAGEAVEPDIPRVVYGYRAFIRHTEVAADRLRNYRLRRGLSQLALARVSGAGINTVSALETPGRRVGVSDRVAAALCVALDVPLSAIWGETDLDEKTLQRECVHEDAVHWNPYSRAVQCSRCGQSFVPLIPPAIDDAALRALLRRFASYATEKRYADECVWCGEQGQDVVSHAPDCPVRQAAGLLAAQGGDL